MRPPSPYGTQRLETSLRPELSIHLTPQMRLRLEILQANILSLEEMLSLEVQQNPALELIEGEPEGEEARTTEEFSIEDFYPHNPGADYEGAEEKPEPGPQCADRSSLEEHMMLTVVHEFSGCEKDYRIARYILEGLDEDGFLHEDSNSIAKALGITEEQVENIRRRIQLLDPIGIASHDIPEALLVQLEALGYNEESTEIRIIKEGFGALLQKRITSLSKRLRLPTEVIAEAFETISSLDPKPGRNFHEIASRSVQPDITIRYREGKLEVVINESPLPGLRLAAKFKEILINPKKFSNEEIEFAKRKLESAQLFIKGILQRRDTLDHLAQNILLRNYDFFSGRTNQSTPLLMKDAAEELRLHASTISRAVRDKYIETPVGIFPLRSFFAKGERNPVMEKLKNIIKTEEKTNPLTDAEITERLKATGSSISRRTVAKYRLRLNIPDCFQRKALG
ncbi:MAG: RNA polymerase factor sigma-54 [Candidatus Stahlbacteria bacterium]|nr:MAG: RNA polymerase factor sigma-54 [Candidatus Stahlbacteria bacterium]